MSTFIRTEASDPVAVITLDDGKANALSLDRIIELREAIEAAAGRARAVVLTGRPGMFCAGLDLRTMDGASPEDRVALRAAGIDLFQGLVRLPVPLVIACTGHAVAGGAMMLLVADLRIGAPGAYQLGLLEVSFGAAMSPFGIELARLRLGAAAYRGTVLATLGAPAEALRMGFLDAVAEEPLTAAMAAATAMATTLDAAAFSATKATFYRRATTL